jgi:NitT/TauT family transport system substrate-binding protein
MIRKTSAFIATTLLVVSMAACSSSSTPSSPSSSGPAVDDKVTVGVIAILDVAPIYLGRDKGIFHKHGIELTMQQAQGGAAIVPAVVSGQYQFGFSNVVSLLLAKSQNVPIKAVANGNNSTGSTSADFGGLFVKDPNIKSPKDLVGKKVATNTLKNIVDTTVKAIVAKDGGDASKVNFVELAFPNMAPALDAGNVDAIFVVEPFLSAAKAKGWKQIGSYADVDPNLCVALYFTSTQLMTQKPDLVKRFTDAMKESLAYAQTHPDEARAELTTYTTIKADDTKNLILPKWPGDIDKTSIDKLAGLAVTYGLLTSKPDLTTLLP